MRELAKLLELNKKRAELEFRKTVLGAECDAELQSVGREADALAAGASRAGIEILVPQEGLLDEFGERLKEFPPERMRDSLRTRSGEAYGVLSQRGEIVKRNHGNRFEIAKLSIAAARIPVEERKKLAEAIRAGRIDEELELGIDEKGSADIAKFMSRCSIACKASGSSLEPAGEGDIQEVRIEICNKPVWISGQAKGRLEGTLQKIAQLNPRIQLKNAERQIKVFNDEEEKDFVSLQRNYLELIKERDELLREYSDEENLSVKID